MTGIEKLSENGVSISQKDIDIIVARYNIKELSVFGSSIRNDFTEKSDIDLLIVFKDSEKISLMDLIDIQDYFEKLTKRTVDIVEPAGLKNPYRREAILNSKVLLYVA